MEILLSIAQLPRATFYYHLKKSTQPDKYKEAKDIIADIYAANRGRYGYRRITAELHNRNVPLNHKTVQRLMKELGLVCRVRTKKYRSYEGEVGKVAPNLGWSPTGRENWSSQEKLDKKIRERPKFCVNTAERRKIERIFKKVWWLNPPPFQSNIDRKLCACQGQRLEGRCSFYP